MLVNYSSVRRNLIDGSNVGTRGFECLDGSDGRPPDELLTQAAL